MGSTEIGWETIRDEVQQVARTGRLLPFFGAALSQFHPTSLPLGAGLLEAMLRGIFPKFGCRGHWSEDESAIMARSVEVVLQGLAEGLRHRDGIASFYNQMQGVSPNPLHYLLAAALVRGRLPAIFTTNQDRCLEDATALLQPVQAIYDVAGFDKGLQPAVYHFHGAVGGSTPEEQRRRRASLTFTLHSMGPRLPSAKRLLLEQGLKNHSLILMGHSCSDPDIWYTLYDFLQAQPTTRIYWCVRDQPSPHLSRLRQSCPESIVVFQGDMVTVLQDLAKAWGLSPFDRATVLVCADEQEAHLEAITGAAPKLEEEQRDLAYGWLLVSVGRHAQAVWQLEAIAQEALESVDYQQCSERRHIHMMASLFAGYARRELSDHRRARPHLRTAADLAAPGDLDDPYRHAQAIHKLGESLSAFESVRWWYWWPKDLRLHKGAKLLHQSIEEYKRLAPDGWAAKQLSRAGLGAAYMNLGQLYRRTAWFTPRILWWRDLPDRAREALEKGRRHLEEEGDMRELSMALAALAADDPAKTRDEKQAILQRSVDIAEHWNQDEIQIGSAHFQMGGFLASAKNDLWGSEQAYASALARFRKAGMKAEIIRTELELMGPLALQARQTMAQVQSSWEWRFGLRFLGVCRAIRSLLLKEALIAMALFVLVLTLVDYRAMLRFILSLAITAFLVLVLVLLRSAGSS